MAVRIPGKIVWLNSELAQQIGIPAEQILEMCSVRALRRGESLDGREPVRLYADQYGGSDILPCRGAGRSGFLSHGNFYLKGVGHTPLYKKHRDDDFQHTHGGLSLFECMLEALFGEVSAHFLTHGSARILAILDQGDFTIHPDGTRVARAIAVRAGSQLRPGHVFAYTVQGQAARLEQFLRIVRATGQLVRRDLTATMLRIVDDHALTAAELYRWRMFHGAISMSNMEMSGAMLDTTTQSIQPRTAPLKVLTDHRDETNIVYGREHLQRAHELAIVYRAIINGLTAAERRAINATKIDFAAAMQQSYERHLHLQMLTAIGLRADVARRIDADYPKVARRATKVLLRMASLRNPGNVNANEVTGERISVLDVFNLLRVYPSHPDRRVIDCLQPIYGGDAPRRKKMRLQVRALIEDFERAYADLMSACHRVAPESYGTIAEMQRSIALRASAENRPLDALYRSNVVRDFTEAVDAYVQSRNPAVISGMLSERIAASRRKCDFGVR